MQRILHLLVITLLPLSLFAQAPQKMSYQAVIRNSSGALVTSKAVGMRVSILQGTANGTEVYKEIYNPNPQTNANGLVSIEIGGGIPVTGTFAGINWANGPYFIKTETDPNGGTNYTISGISQLLSVPYALYAGNVVNGGGKPILYLTGDITNAQAQAKIAAEVGANTQQIYISGCSSLTSIDLSMITDAVDIEIYNNQNLQNLNFSKLETTRELEISDCPKLTTLNLSQIKQLGYMFVEETALTTFALNSISPSANVRFEITNNSQLTSISVPNFTKSNGIYITNNNALTSITMPGLQTAGRIDIGDNSALASINFQSLISIRGGDGGGALSFFNNDALTNISFPNLQALDLINILENNALTTVSFPVLKSVGSAGAYTNGTQIRGNQNLGLIQLPSLTNFTSTNNYNYFDFSYNTLPSSQINTLLNRLVNLTPSLTGTSINLSGQNPSAPPTGQGLVDKATLISRGNTVQTD